MLVAKIDKDYLYQSDSPFEPIVESRVGKEFILTASYSHEIFPDNEIGPKTRFRCKDDDGIVYYGGWLYNDADCEVQTEVLRWCMADAGCTTIEVKNDAGFWRQEIG